MNQYVCVKGWARNKVGDVIDEWTFKRYPPELRSRHFELIVPKPTKQASPAAKPIEVPKVVEAPVRIEQEVELKVEADTDADAPKEIFEKKFKRNL